MVELNEHPTVQWLRERGQESAAAASNAGLDYQWLRQLCFQAGADDVGFVRIDHPELADQRQDILTLFPGTQTLVSLVCRMNREPIRSVARSVANVEFHRVTDKINHAAARIVSTLEEKGIRALNPAAGFPMETSRFPGGKIWVVSHKPVAVAAGLGRMGIHRNVIHPKFGSFILLATVLVDARVTEYNNPIDYNPCLECKLCVAACPTGAISADGNFDFSACNTHNYREFLGGFTDWVETIAESGSAREYRQKVSGSESASMWQSLSFGANYKAAYCLSVCPAGEDVIAPFLTDRPRFLREVVKPLQDKEETVHVVPGSDAEAYVKRRFPHKRTKQVGNGLRVESVNAFLSGLPLVFQRGKSKGLNATYHFTFTGREERKATVVISGQRLRVTEGLSGKCNLHVMADSLTWVRLLARDANPLWAIVRRKIRIKGSPRFLLAFRRCFPS
ncbi:MAG TPA: SCP2 sterol-binding domain-containing protein [Bryobacteraceae bacterium]|nr:SCP2 sterol-binding domain-containing protein [Bryobacteraceae bacterium]